MAGKKKGGGGISGKTGQKKPGAPILGKRMLGKEEVFPTLYVGKHVGHGKYMAGFTKNGDLIRDEDGRPIPYKQIGRLV